VRFRLSVFTLACGALAGLAYSQQPPAPAATPEQIQELTALVDKLKALIQAGELTEASSQLSTLSASIYKITMPVLPTPQQQLERMEKSLRNDTATRFSTNWMLAQLALDAGQLEKAEDYAKDLLALAPRFMNSTGYGDALHHGNLMIGRVALQRDHNLYLAKSSLMAAAAVPTTPILQKYGPNMALARDLLAAGERDTVLQYLAMCRSIWTEGQKKLDDWTALIQAGGIPNFGANLIN